MNSLQQNTRLSALSHREAKACSTEIWASMGRRENRWLAGVTRVPESDALLAMELHLGPLE